MIAVMQRLLSVVGLEPSENTLQDYQWTLTQQLKVQNTSFFEPLINTHQVLHIEYNVLCTHLISDYNKEQKDEDEITDQLVAALMLAELLTVLYKDYLAVPREVVRLKDDSKIFRTLLIQRRFTFAEDLPPSQPADTLTQLIRLNTAAINWIRLILIRSKRVFSTALPLLKDMERLSYFIITMDKYANPAITYLSWAFFIPRLSSNLFLFAKHLIPHPWMGDKEKELKWSVRFNAQLQRRWFEVGNDVVWLTSGALNCFVLLGPLAPIGVYINVVLFAYDVVLACLRAAIELGRLRDLQNEYKIMSNNMTNDKAPLGTIEELGRYQEHLQKRINFEHRRLMISVGNTSGLFMAILLSLPVFAATPVLPLVGAVLLVSVTITSFILTTLLENHRPINNVQLLKEPKKLVYQENTNLTLFQSKKIEQIENNNNEKMLHN